MTKGRAEYRLAPEARRDLEGIWLYTLERWGLEQAIRYIDQLDEKFAQLAENPKLARACDDIREGYRRCEVARHVIYYRITDYGIDVIRVLHESMDQGRHL